MSHPPDKQALLAEASSHIAAVRTAVEAEIKKTSATLARVDETYGTDLAVRQKLKAHFSERLDQLHHLFPSPYFFRCDVHSEGSKTQSLYFSKFLLADQNVFSWTSPAARLRFASVGPTSYTLHDASKTWSGTLERKDQFLIVGGKVMFMASEAETYARTLVHQEKLAQRKTGFVLPEIVERMEKAQDDVIRAPETGSFLIAGPAGSGKTTLALHRLAYLLQSPDTAERFPARRMVVFVQDERTKAYFSRLLPDLGIHDVEITTFGAWALERLGLEGYAVIRRPNGVDDALDGFERRKLLALRALPAGTRSKNPFTSLRAAYKPSFTAEDKRRLDAQEETKQLDRFDLSLLLAHALERGPLMREEEYLVQRANYRVTRRTRLVPLTYSLVVVDETQNYLPEQLAVLRSCVDADTKAMLYVGDLGQQVLLGTIRDWKEAGEAFDGGRRVALEKVYRNTKAILRYVSARGYPTVIPEDMAEGAPVVEHTNTTIEKELAHIRRVMEENPGKQIGILAPSTDVLRPFLEAFDRTPNIHVLTVHEAQGVEFDLACVLGFSKEFFTTTTDEDAAFVEERAKIKRDLFYVALTRAMDALHVLER